MTRETLAKLPDNVRTTLESLRKAYKNDAFDHDIVRGRIGGYCRGLCDAGMITERERKILVVYAMT